MTLKLPIFFVRHVISESNHHQTYTEKIDPTQLRPTLTKGDFFIEATQEGLEQTNISAIIRFAEENPTKKFVIISSPYERCLKTAQKVKSLFHEILNKENIYGPKTNYELREHNPGTEDRVNIENHIKPLFGEIDHKITSGENPYFWNILSGSKNNQIFPNNDLKPIGGESFNELTERGNSFSSILRNYSNSGNLNLLDIDNSKNIFKEPPIPIIVSHSWMMNSILNGLGVLNLNGWKDLVEIKNANSFKISNNGEKFSSEITFELRVPSKQEANTKTTQH